MMGDARPGHVQKGGSKLDVSAPPEETFDAIIWIIVKSGLRKPDQATRANGLLTPLERCGAPTAIRGEEE